MPDDKFYMKNAWRALAGLEELPEYITPAPSLASLKETEWSPKFEELMRNRLVMGAIRYGLLHAAGKPKYDRTDSIIRRAKLYRETGNLEVLVDIANMCLLEYEEGNHPLRHFRAIDDGLHTKVVSPEE
jgi:hypothetical protein